MSLQRIKSLSGKDEYILLPVAIYKVLKDEIDSELAHRRKVIDSDYVPFVLEDYVDNPIALARMKANLTQEQLAERLGVSQAYVSKIERQESVTPALLDRATKAIRRKA
jgi:ribosome-binding protein aMBF1 (putative translation factor)